MTQNELQLIAEECRSWIKSGQEPTRKAIEDIEGRLTVLSREMRRESGRSSVTDVLTAALSKRPTEPLVGKQVAEIQVKDITGISLAMPGRYEGVTMPGRPALNVRALISSSPTSEGSLDYLEETTFTNNAAPVAEGAAKPKSDKTFTARNVAIRTIAHFFKMSKQTYDDLPSVVATVENNGLWGLADKIEQQILKGTGTAPELGPGIYNVATAISTPPAGDTLVDTWFKAVAALGAAGYSVNGIVTSWANWSTFSLLKDDTKRYIAGNTPALPPIVPSKHMTGIEWVAGDFQRGCHIFERQTATLEVAVQNVDDFEKNLVTLRIEERLALAVWLPAAFLKNSATGVMAEESETPPRRGR